MASNPSSATTFTCQQCLTRIRVGASGAPFSSFVFSCSCGASYVIEYGPAGYLMFIKPTPTGGTNGPRQAAPAGAPANPGPRNAPLAGPLHITAQPPHRTRADARAGAGEGSGLSQYDALGPLEGIRCWHVRQGGLRSLAIETTWDPDGPTRARCHDGGNLEGSFWPDRAAPDPACACGIWVLRPSHIDVVGLTNGVCGPTLRMGVHVFGRVRFWGDVTEYEGGWRAEYAQPVALFRTWEDGFEEEAQAVADVYGIAIEDPPPELVEWMERVEEPVMMGPGLSPKPSRAWLVFHRGVAIVMCSIWVYCLYRAFRAAFP